MLSPRARIGRAAEKVAAIELGKLGYQILVSNYTCKQGEIDIIAREADSLAFVEVRCKRTASFGSPAESITKSKQHKIALTAQHYLQEHSLHDINCRFDVVEVVVKNGNLAVAEIIKDAFTL